MQPPTRHRQSRTSLPDQVVAYLREHGEVTDEGGMAATRLRQAVGFDGPSSQFSNLLLRLEQTGVVNREVKGRRTYRVALQPEADFLRPGPRRAVATGSTDGSEGLPAGPGWATTAEPGASQSGGSTDSRAEPDSSPATTRRSASPTPRRPARGTSAPADTAGGDGEEEEQEGAGRWATSPSAGPAPAPAPRRPSREMAERPSLPDRGAGRPAISGALSLPVEPTDLADALRTAAALVEDLGDRLSSGRMEATAAARRRIDVLDRRVGELERDVARARAERDSLGNELAALQARYEVAQRNLDLLAERSDRPKRPPTSRQDPRAGAATLDRLLRMEGDSGGRRPRGLS